jgi:hypothetical protein
MQVMGRDHENLLIDIQFWYRKFPCYHPYRNCFTIILRRFETWINMFSYFVLRATFALPNNRYAIVTN